MARPMASSSAFSAKVPGIGSPETERWPTVREVEKPKAPACSPSCTMRPMAAKSSSVASSWRRARSPIT